MVEVRRGGIGMLASVFGEWVDVSPKMEVKVPVSGSVSSVFGEAWMDGLVASDGWAGGSGGCVGGFCELGNPCTVGPSGVHYLHDTRAIAFLRLSINKVNIGITQGYRSGGVPMKRSARRCATRHGASRALERNPEQP